MVESNVFRKPVTTIESNVFTNLGGMNIKKHRFNILI